MIYLIALVWLLAIIYCPPLRRVMSGLSAIALFLLAVIVAGSEPPNSPDHNLMFNIAAVMWVMGGGLMFYSLKPLFTGAK
jgi:peptidoglycan/LPS O-acetylase OafA/YrhL